jgi:hypothetical protein
MFGKSFNPAKDIKPLDGKVIIITGGKLQYLGNHMAIFLVLTLP